MSGRGAVSAPERLARAWLVLAACGVVHVLVLLVPAWHAVAGPTAALVVAAALAVVVLRPRGHRVRRSF